MNCNVMCKSNTIGRTQCGQNKAKQSRAKQNFVLSLLLLNQIKILNICKEYSEVCISKNKILERIIKNVAYILLCHTTEHNVTYKQNLDAIL